MTWKDMIKKNVDQMSDEELRQAIKQQVSKFHEFMGFNPPTELIAQADKMTRPQLLEAWKQFSQ